MSDKAFFRNKIILINSVMSTAVVFAHSNNIDRYSNLRWESTEPIEFLFSRGIGNLAVQMFFLMSSILFFLNYNKDTMLQKYKSRVKSVLLPFFVWNIIYYLFFIVLTALPLSRSFMDTKQVAVNLETILNAVLFYQYNGVYWFMYQLILFIIISPLLYALIKNKYGFLVPIGCVVAYYWLPTIPMCAHALRTDMLVYWTLGAYMAIHQTERMNRKNNQAPLYLGISIVLIAIRFYLEGIAPNTISNYWLSVLVLINVITVWWAFDLFRLKKVYEWMTMSFFIYSLHPLIVDTIKKAFATLLPDNDIMAFVNYFLTAIGSIALCYVAGKILIRFLPGLYDVLSGGRLKRVEKKQG